MAETPVPRAVRPPHADPARDGAPYAPCRGDAASRTGAAGGDARGGRGGVVGSAPRTGRRYGRHGRGFTLLEVLVALAVLAVALTAALQLAAQGAANLTYLRDKAFAQWVALNEVARQQVAPEWPPTGTTRGSAWMGGREWPWEVRVQDTDDHNVRRLEVAVGEGETPLVRLTAYALRPFEPGAPGPAAPGPGGPGPTASAQSRPAVTAPTVKGPETP